MSKQSFSLTLIDNLLISRNLYSKNYKIDADWENLINNSSSKFETQLESIINMESFDREKIQKVIKKVINNGEDNIEIVWNTDDPFFK